MRGKGTAVFIFWKFSFWLLISPLELSEPVGTIQINSIWQLKTMQPHSDFFERSPGNWWQNWCLITWFSFWGSLYQTSLFPLFSVATKMKKCLLHGNRFLILSSTAHPHKPSAQPHQNSLVFSASAPLPLRVTCLNCPPPMLWLVKLSHPLSPSSTAFYIAFLIIVTGRNFSCWEWS